MILSWVLIILVPITSWFPRKQTLIGRGKKQEWAKGEVKSNANPMPALANPIETVELEWPFGVVPNWAKMARPLFSHIDHSLGVDCSGKDCGLGHWTGQFSVAEAIPEDAKSWRPSVACTHRSWTASPWEDHGVYCSRLCIFKTNLCIYSLLCHMYSI